MLTEEAAGFLLLTFDGSGAHGMNELVYENIRGQ